MFPQKSESIISSASHFRLLRGTAGEGERIGMSWGCWNGVELVADGEGVGMSCWVGKLSKWASMCLFWVHGSPAERLVNLSLVHPLGSCPASHLSPSWFQGAGKMILETGEHPAVLRNAVCTPGGTTICAVHELEKGAFRATVMNAVEAATTRSRELGKR